MIPAHLVGAERRTYLAGADKSRAAYRKRHGATELRTVAERRDWQSAHSESIVGAEIRGGMAAVRKMHTARVAMLETMSDPDRIGGPATGGHLATLTRDAEHAAERLAILSPAKATRKAPARKLASVPDVVAAPAVAPVNVPDVVAPENVPADVQTYPQIRAARKASRRELAAKMRAVGIHPNGVAWQLARAGVDLADIPAILSGDAAMPEGVNA